MGQRLCIQIKRGEQNLANAYYHWSAYTRSSLYLTRVIVGHLSHCEHEFQDDVSLAVSLLQATGARMDASECAAAKDQGVTGLKESHTINRNDGILAITEGEMESNMEACEYFLEMDLEDRMVNFNVLSEHDKEDFISFYSEEEDDADEAFASMPCWPINLDFFPFERVYTLCEELDTFMDFGYYYLKQSDDLVYSVVE